MSDSKKLFNSQSGIRGAGISANVATGYKDYTQNNLFAGMWEVGQANIDRFDHFLTGYGFFFWTKPCRFMGSGGLNIWDNFKALTERNFKSIDGIQNFTLESDAVVHGIAGNEFPVATNMKKDITTFTLKHQELAGSPIRELYQAWATGIRDPETGLAHYHGLINSSNEWIYSLKNHTAEAIYVVTDPSGANIGGGEGSKLSVEYACYFTSVFPTVVPQQHLNYAAGEHAPVEIDIEFRCTYHQSKVINELAVEYMKAYYIRNMYGDYDPKWKAGGQSEAHDVSFKEGYNESKAG